MTNAITDYSALTAALRNMVTLSEDPTFTEDDFAMCIIDLIDVYGKDAVDEVFTNPERYFLYN